jgi:hypothetical protein
MRQQSLVGEANSSAKSNQVAEHRVAELGLEPRALGRHDAAAEIDE